MSESPTGRRRGAVVDPLHPGRSREIRVPLEELLELRADGRRLVRLLRTPGHDIELVHGYLLGAGLISGRDDVRSARYCEGTSISAETGCAENSYNVVSVALSGNRLPAEVGPVPPSGAGRSFQRQGADADRVMPPDNATVPAGAGFASSGTTQPGIADDVVAPVAIGEDATIVEAALLRRIVAKLAQERVYLAASLTLPGISTVRTDVHLEQAVDKAVGWAMLAGLLPLEGAVLGVSGAPDVRVITHAVRAGVPIVVSTRLPSSAAVGMAAEHGVTVAVVQDAAPRPDVVVLTVPDRVEEGAEE